MRLATRSRIIASALAVVAVAAPTALARPYPDQQSTQTSVVGPPLLRPAPASQQAAIDRAQAERASATFYSPPAGARYSSAATNAYASSTRPVAVTAPTIGTPGDGFDYGDAAIGAGITAAIALLITAGTLAVRRRSQPQHG